MNFKPQLVGKEPVVGIPKGSPLEDLDLSNVELSQFRSRLKEETRSLGSWELLPQPILKLFQELRPTRVAIFFPKTEWGEPFNIVTLAMQHSNAGNSLLGPQIIGDRMEFQKLKGAELLMTSLGVHHVKSDTDNFEHPDLVLVPALCCDLKGNRIGRGKGFYDRYLESCKKTNSKVISCAVIHSNFLFNELPPHFFHSGDQRVHYVLTEKEILKTSFNNKISGNEVPV